MECMCWYAGAAHTHWFVMLCLDCVDEMLLKQDVGNLFHAGVCVCPGMCRRGVGDFVVDFSSAIMNPNALPMYQTEPE